MIVISPRRTHHRGIKPYPKNHRLHPGPHIYLLVITLFLALSSNAQQDQPSNIRRKSIPVQAEPLQMDSLSIVPGSLVIPGVPESGYRLDFVNAVIRWVKLPPFDSVNIVYRVFPYRLNETTQYMRFDTVMGKFAITPIGMRGRRDEDAIFQFGSLNHNGSLGRGLSFGNRQDLVLNSTLNLQLNGYIGDSILLAAAITDNNIPVQPDGNTQNLNEFDQVFVQFSKDKWRFSIGDIDLRQQQGYFLNFYKRLQGAVFETETKLSKQVVNKVLASGAVAKGKFTRNVFNGLEGNQGPYRLKGANNELFFIVLAGTERVFIDGEMLQRGQDQDYVINYNTAEVTFTPKQMITKDKRISIEFEYADRNYLNAQIYLSDELRIHDRLTLRIGGYLNNDAKNSPVNQTLDTKQKQYLADIGDSLQYARYPSAVADTFSIGKILYELRDTVLTGGMRDTIYVFSTDRRKDLYSLSFTDVGSGKGNYVQDLANGANGKVYKWVAPDPFSAAPRGQFEPAVLLVAPRRQEVFTFGADYTIGAQTRLKTEMAMSLFDVNSFSSRDKGNDRGFAARVMLDHATPINRDRGLDWKNDLYYEYVQSAFKPVERLRNVEFNRDWGLPYDATPADEHLFSMSTGLKDKKDHSVSYIFSGFMRTSGYHAMRNELRHQASVKGWKLNNQFRFTSLDEKTQRGHFLRPVIHIDKAFPQWKNHRVGMQYALEHTELRYKSFDSLNLSSFSFDILQVYLKSPEQLPNKWGISYFTRSDRYPFGNQLVRTDRSRNVNIFMDLMRSEHHSVRFNTTFRKLQILDSKYSTLKPDETILGRVEYNASIWKGALTGNILYELGTGQEPRRDFSYLEVPAGQGEFAWIDYNNDGIQQLNEFEAAQFRDQAKFIRIFTPTSIFIKANYLQFNYSLVFNPRAAINPAKAKGLQKLLVRSYFSSALQVSRKSVADGLASFDPFEDPFSDSALITLDRLLSNSFSFNRTSPVWGFDINNLRTSGRAFLSFGYETRQLNDWNLKARYNVGKSVTFNINGRRLLNQLATPTFANRNYLVKAHSAEPKIVYTMGTVFRIQGGYIWTDKRNIQGVEHSVSNAIQTEAKYNVLSNTALATRFTFNRIVYNSIPNTSVSYLMLDGLLPGKNYIWTIDLTQRLSSFLELNMQYEGRKSGSSGMVHVGRAQVRALF